ncbi:MAG: TIGR03663 family protein [Candidatus Sumerlaeota bacterium]|nr:TIGR03663 family protein [Candidatus Sumerlaeota bacterium]
MRPMHTDEAVHAAKFGDLLDKGIYEYNPYEYHGPVHYYFSLPFVWLSETRRLAQSSDSTQSIIKTALRIAFGARSFAQIPNTIPLRIVPVLFGTGLILLLLLALDGLGGRAATGAALLTALSPAMVYYSRYYIAETPLVFFTFAAIVCGWRYSRSQKIGWALAAGAALGFMKSAKETSLIAFAAMAGGAALTVLWTRLVEGRALRPWKRFRKGHVLAAFLVAAGVAILCLTCFLRRPVAIFEISESFYYYAERALTGDSSTEGAGVHNHPWYFYLQMLAYVRYGRGPWWSEGLILVLFVVGAISILKRSPRAEGDVPFLRFVTFYTLLMTAIYSIIPYKTPWCLLSFLHGMILVAGIGADAILRRLPYYWLKAVALILLAAGLWNLGGQAWRANFRFYADNRNPYVYAHTCTDFMNLVRRVEDISKVSPDKENMLIKVITLGDDSWPLPWYLRGYNRVGYWNWRRPPQQPDAPVIITMPACEEKLDSLLKGKYQKQFFGLRPEVLMLLYIQQPLWDAFIAERAGASSPANRN